MAKFQLSADPQGLAQPIYSSSASQLHGLGERAVIGGQVFRYVKAGTTALVVGNALQAPVQDVDHDQLVATAAAIGAETITVTTGSSAVTLNQYADGWATIAVTPGLGYQYPIKGHPAAATTATCVLTLGRPVEVALTTSSRVTLTMNPHKGVIQHPVTTASGVPVGGAVYPIAISEFGWIQSNGPGAGLIAGTPAVGQPVTTTGAVAGALTVHSAELSNVAYMLTTGVDQQVVPVYWLLG